jgi:hypothetical protein
VLGKPLGDEEGSPVAVGKELGNTLGRLGLGKALGNTLGPSLFVGIALGLADGNKLAVLGITLGDEDGSPVFVGIELGNALGRL